MRFAACLSVLLLFAGIARAEPKNDWQEACRSYRDPNFRSCTLDLAGAEPVDRVQARGDEMIRAFVLNGVRIIAPVVIVEAMLSKKGAAVLTVRDPLYRDFHKSFHLKRTAFAELRQRVAALRSNGANLHGDKADPSVGQRKAKPGYETICLDAPEGLVDVVLEGKAASTSLDFCDLEDSAFLEHLLTLVRRKDSFCEPVFQHDGMDGLRECLHITGNRALAAKTFWASGRIANLGGGKDAPKPEDVAELIAPNVTLAISGQSEIVGRSAVVQTWSVQSEGQNYNYCKPESASAQGNKIAVRGFCYRSAKDSDGMQAAFTQSWRSGQDGKPRLAAWRIGEFLLEEREK